MVPCRVTYGAFHVFHGERSSPYGLAIGALPPPPPAAPSARATGRNAQRPASTACAELFGLAAPSQSSPNTGLARQSSP